MFHYQLISCLHSELLQQDTPPKRDFDKTKFLSSVVCETQHRNSSVKIMCEQVWLFVVVFTFCVILFGIGKAWKLMRMAGCSVLCNQGRSCSVSGAKGNHASIFICISNIFVVMRLGEFNILRRCMSENGVTFCSDQLVELSFPWLLNFVFAPWPVHLNGCRELAYDYVLVNALILDRWVPSSKHNQGVDVCNTSECALSCKSHSD